MDRYEGIVGTAKRRTDGPRPVLDGLGTAIDWWIFHTPDHEEHMYVIATRVLSDRYFLALIRVLAIGDGVAMVPAGSYVLGCDDDDGAREAVEHFARTMTIGHLPYHPTTDEDHALWNVSAWFIPAMCLMARTGSEG